MVFVSLFLCLLGFFLFSLFVCFLFVFYILWVLVYFDR